MPRHLCAVRADCPTVHRVSEPSTAPGRLWPGLRFAPLSAQTLAALLHEDLAAARRSSGVPLTPYFLEQNWLWRIRLDQIREQPEAAPWVARAAVIDTRDAPEGLAVGALGFHGAPDPAGMVEVGYSVDPAFRRRGLATAMLRLALEEAAADPQVRVVRASIGPDNEASLATIRPFGFVHVGEQIDTEDGLELVFEWDATT